MVDLEAEKVDFTSVASRLAAEKQASGANASEMAAEDEDIVWADKIKPKGEDTTGEGLTDKPNNGDGLGETTKDDIYRRGAEYLAEMGDLGLSNASAAILKQDVAKFRAKPGSITDIERAYYATLKFYDFDVKGNPLVQLIILMFFVYILPFITALREKKKEEKAVQSQPIQRRAQPMHAPDMRVATGVRATDKIPHQPEPVPVDRVQETKTTAKMVCTNPECSNLHANKAYCSQKCNNRHRALIKREKDA